MVNDRIIFNVIKGDKSLPTLQYGERKITRWREKQRDKERQCERECEREREGWQSVI